MNLEEKKKLLYRSKHRGCKEMDILLGNFASKFLFTLSDSELAQYKKVIEMDDLLIYQYIIKQRRIPKQLSILYKVLQLID